MHHKILFYNGLIYLGNKTFGYAFEIENNKFTNIYLNKKDVDLKQHSIKVNLQNHLVIPSLIDTHSHLLPYSRSLRNVDLKNVKDFSTLKDLITKKIKAENPKYIYAENFNETIYENGKYPTRHNLDLISDTIPIFINRMDLHLAMVNTAGLKFIGVFKENFKSEFGARIDLEPDSKLPNGIIGENALQHIRKKLIEFYDFNSDYQGLKQLNQILINYGIANVFTCDIFEGKQNYIFSLFDKLTKENDSIRINHQIVFYHPKKLKEYLEFLKNKPVNEFNKISDVKIFYDGSLGSKTASVQYHYCNEPNNFGILNYSQDDVKQYLEIAKKYHKQLAIHCIGDKASLLATQLYLEDDSQNLNRNKIIHFQLFDQNIVMNLLKANVLVSAQPCFYEADFKVLNDYIDSKVANYSYRFNLIHKLNKNLVSFSTDAPVCSINPWENIYYAINGNQLEGQKNQALAFDIYDAIDCYTINGAYACFDEKIRGKIAIDYLADFIVLNQNIFDLKNDKDILNTKVVLHYINGKKVN